MATTPAFQPSQANEMKNMSQKHSSRRGGLRAMLLVPLMGLATACTDLTEVPRDALTPDNAFRTEE